MKEEEKLIETYGRKGPWRVPDGYFESVRTEVMEKLPPYPEAPRRAPLTLWQKVKPYVYLAAMFAGIWCMMKVFHHASGMDTLSLDNPPEAIAAYMEDPEITEEFLLGKAFADEDLIDEVSENYDSFEEFERDFGYQLAPQYRNLPVN